MVHFCGEEYAAGNDFVIVLNMQKPTTSLIFISFKT